MKKILESRKKELEYNIEAVEGESVLEEDSHLTYNEVGDEASENVEKLTKVEKKEVYEELLALTNKALEDLEEDRYGICNKCEGKIEEERLMATPEVQYCIRCQNEIE